MAKKRAKNGIFPVDDKTLAYVAGRSSRKPSSRATRSPNTSVIDIDCPRSSDGAFPHLPKTPDLTTCPRLY
jgi:homoaconitase/3-isopropylmalate dehydratase large subunit